MGVCIANTINAQYQSLFGNTNTSWNLTRSNLGWAITDSIITTTDTIINGKTYQQITSYDLPSMQFPSNHKGFLREDVVQGKAWFFSSTDTTERLIMDLSLNVGDSFRIVHSWSGLDDFFLVDSVWVSGAKKHVRLDYYEGFGHSGEESLTFIEGVGTTKGIGYHRPLGGHKGRHARGREHGLAHRCLCRNCP